MTNEQIRQLTIMRREGAGYGTIADALHLSINTVKSWCRRHHLPDGSRPALVCENCGKPITQVPGRKHKRFCSDKCRNAWWNSHLDLVKHKTTHTYVCPNCGKEFTVYGGRKRKYCCHACYIAHRFGGSHG